jgi:hypothetical protein
MGRNGLNKRVELAAIDAGARTRAQNVSIIVSIILPTQAGGRRAL